MSEHIILPSSRIAPGHCVIMGDTGCPAGKQVVVVMGQDDNTVKGYYLAADINCVTCWDHVDRVTPVSWFGVRVVFDGKRYWCELDDSLPKTATYPGGEPRPWQERHGPIHCQPMETPLRLALEIIRKGDSHGL